MTDALIDLAASWLASSTCEAPSRISLDTFSYAVSATLLRCGQHAPHGAITALVMTAAVRTGGIDPGLPAASSPTEQLTVAWAIAKTASSLPGG